MSRSSFLRFMAVIGLFLCLSLPLLLLASNAKRFKVKVWSRPKSSTEVPVTVYPHTCDFGTVGSPAATNDLWHRKGLKRDGKQFSFVSTNAWGFQEIPNGNGALAPTFNAGTWVSEKLSHTFLFSRQFYLDKTDTTTRYTLDLNFYMPNDPNANETFTVRVHKVLRDDDVCFPADFAVSTTGVNEAFSDMMIYNGDTLQSMAIDTLHFTMEDKGYCNRRLEFAAKNLPESGRYKFSIIFSASEREEGTLLYLTGLTVEEHKSGSVDLMAGQLISPHTATLSSYQGVSFFVHNNSVEPVEGFKAGFQLDNGRKVTGDFSEKTLASRSVTRVEFPADSLGDILPGDHKIRFWVSAEDDKTPSNDTSAYYNFVVTEAVPAEFTVFRFTSEADACGWTSFSDSLETEPAWRYVQGDNQSTWRFSASTSKGRREDAHDDVLFSPYLSFVAGKAYSIEVSYQAYKNTEVDLLDFKNLSARVSSGNSYREAYAESKPLLWQRNGISNTGRRTINFIYLCDRTQDACIALRSFGPPSGGGLNIHSVGVAEIEYNKMDFVYDFEAYSESSQAHLARKAVVADQDANLDMAGNTSGWSISASGHQSDYSAYCRGIIGDADDWLVFNPILLEKDSTYHFSLYTKVQEQGQKAALEFYLQSSTPRYDLAYDLQPGWKTAVEIQNDAYQKISYDIKADTTAYHFLAIRNVTSIKKANTDADDMARKQSVYVDNISLLGFEKFAVQATDAKIPYEAYLGGDGVTLTLMFRNFSSSFMDKNKVNFCYQVDNGPVVRDRFASDISPLYTGEHTFDDPVDFSRVNDTCTVCFWVETEGSVESIDTIRVQVIRLQPKTLPYEEEFSENALLEWQAYPYRYSSSWYVYQGLVFAGSGRYAMACHATVDEPVYLVSPVIVPEKDTVYRVAFRYRRAYKGEGEKLGLYYAKNFETVGFKPLANAEFSVDSADYTQCVAYVRFPEGGKQFLALGTQPKDGSSTLYIDDFSIADSVYAHSSQIILTASAMPDSYSWCDTAFNSRGAFWVKNESFLDVDNVHIKYFLDNETGVDTVLPHMARHDSVLIGFNLSRLPAGSHTLKAYACMVHEWDRTDDTIMAEFFVKGPSEYPFAEKFEGTVYGTGSVDVNGDRCTWEVTEDAENAYSGSHCLAFIPKEGGVRANDIFFTDGFTVTEAYVGKKQALTFCMKATNVEDREETAQKVGVRLMKYGENGGFVSATFLGQKGAGNQYKVYGLPLYFSEPGTYALAFFLLSNQCTNAFYIDSIVLGTPKVPNPVAGLAVNVDSAAYKAVFTYTGGEENNVLRVSAAGGSWQKDYVLTGGTLTLNMREEGMSYNTYYSAQARSINIVDDSSAWSDAVEFRMPKAPAPKPIVLAVRVEGAKVIFTYTGGETDNTLHISAVNGSWQKDYTFGNEGTFELDMWDEEMPSSTTFTAKARSRNTEGDVSDWSNEVSFATAPDTYTEGTGNIRSGVLSVWPNPVAGKLNVLLPAWTERWIVFDMQGKNVYEDCTLSSEINIDGLKQGVYILRAFGKDASGRMCTASVKVIKR